MSGLLSEMYPDGPPERFSVSLHTWHLERPGYAAWWNALADEERQGYEKQIAECDAREEARLKAEAESIARAKATQEAASKALRWEHLVARGIPLKDLERVHSGALDETPALAEARSFLADADLRTLVLSGGKGCGKTTAASWIAYQESPDEYQLGTGNKPDFYLDLTERPTGFKKPWPAARHPRFVDVSVLARVSRYKSEEMEPLERCSILVIDDLGMEYADEKGSFLATLDGIFNARYANKLRTVITTNLNRGSFKPRYGERIADRIRESGRFVELAGESLRRKP
jgi:DNA replication protein DnaC